MANAKPSPQTAPAAGTRLSRSSLSSLTGWLPAWATRRPLLWSALVVGMGTVLVLGLTVWMILSRYYIYLGDVSSMVWSPDGSRLVVCYDDGSLHMLTFAEGSSAYSSRILDRAGSPLSLRMQYMAWSPDGRFIVGGIRGSRNSATVIDAESGRELYGANFSELDVDKYAWSPDSRRIAMRCRGGSDVRIWDLDQPAIVDSLEYPNQPAIIPYDTRFDTLGVAWSPEGSRYIKRLDKSGEMQWGSGAGRYIALPWPDVTFVYDLSKTDKTERARQTGLNTPKVGCVAWSPDGQNLATISRETSTDEITGSVWSVDPPYGKKILNLLSPPRPVPLPGSPPIDVRRSKAMGWSLDGQTIGAALQVDDHRLPNAVELIWWDATTGKPRASRSISGIVPMLRAPFSDMQLVPRPQARTDNDPGDLAWSPTLERFARAFNFSFVRPTGLHSAGLQMRGSVIRIYMRSEAKAY